MVQWANRPLLWFTSKIDIPSIKKPFLSKKSLLSENKKLQEEITRLEQKFILVEETQKENVRLKQLLAFQKEFDYQTIPAKVIGRDPTRWYRGILIDKGSSDGLKKNMPVVTRLGLVGHVSQVTPTDAKVQLLVDVGSRVGALLQESREIGILKGLGRRGSRLDYLSRRVSLQVGEKVLTSGIGSLYPKGILIGNTTNIQSKEGGLYQSVRVKPSVDFSKLEEVLVLDYAVD